MKEGGAKPETEGGKEKGGPREKGFFAIDRRTWKSVCDLGLNEAVVYLIMASGTDRAQKTTKWSARAVEQRVNISWPKAKKVQQNLINKRWVKQIKGGQRPVYELVPYEVWAETFQEQRPAMTPVEQAAYARIAAGETSIGSFEMKDRHHVRELIRKRWVHDRSPAEKACYKGEVYKKDGAFLEAVPEDRNAPQTEYIWLPNSIIDGTKSGEIPPIEKLRAGQDVEELRLFVDLYYIHDLAEEGGIKKNVLQRTYSRQKIGTHWGYLLLGFKQDRLTVSWGNAALDKHLTKPDQKGNWSADDLWPRLGRLQDLGLVQIVPCIFEGETDTANLMFPCGWGTKKNPEDKLSPEDELGALAHRAGTAMAQEMELCGCNALNEARGHRLVPVPAHTINATMIGVLRMRYRPKETRKTKEWWALQNRQLKVWRPEFEKIIQREEAARATRENQQQAAGGGGRDRW